MVQLEINIDLGGATEIKVKGVAGPGCTKLTESLEKALGKTTASVKTPEYHQTTRQAAQAKAGT